MKHYEVILPRVSASVEAKPYETLKKWMTIKYYGQKCQTDMCSVRNEIEAEIVNVWVLLFRSKEAISIALDLLEHDIDDGNLNAFCHCYSSVLKEMIIEVRR